LTKIIFHSGLYSEETVFPHAIMLGCEKVFYVSRPCKAWRLKLIQARDNKNLRQLRRRRAFGLQNSRHRPAAPGRSFLDTIFNGRKGKVVKRKRSPHCLTQPPA